MKKIGEPLTVKEMRINWEDYSQKLEKLVTKADMSSGNLVNPGMTSRKELNSSFTPLTVGS
jgi:uncharacterized protein YjaG (DUF416 family)